MPDLMNLADVVIVAAEAEGLARVYMEAMACERVLLASDIAPAREVVQDGVNALLFRMGDTDDLAAKTLLAVGDPQLRARIGPKARESMQSRSIERAVDRYVSELEGFVARSR
jgi:glycosyltransferase involved in cell wall biosynthesis